MLVTLYATYLLHKLVILFNYSSRKFLYES